MAIPIALLRIAMWKFFGETEPSEAIKMVLAAVSVALVLYWVVQGYFAARLKVEISGEAYRLSSQKNDLVLASVHIANIGDSNVSLERAILKVSPGSSMQPCPSGDEGLGELYLEPGQKEPAAIRIGLDSREYTIVWGTEETRQVAIECPPSDYYRLNLELFVRQAFADTEQTWRATAVVPTVESVGKSPEWTKSDEKKSSLTESIKRGDNWVGT